MLEGYKTLRALQDTGGESFTVEDLAAASDVGPATIRTVLAREALVEEIGTQRTGRRGASPKIYRLREGAQPKLDERLGAIEELGRPLDDERESLPTALLAAEEILLAPHTLDLGESEQRMRLGWLGYDAG